MPPLYYIMMIVVHGDDGDRSGTHASYAYTRHGGKTMADGFIM